MDLNTTANKFTDGIYKFEGSKLKECDLMLLSFRNRTTFNYKLSYLLRQCLNLIFSCVTGFDPFKNIIVSLFLKTIFYREVTKHF